MASHRSHLFAVISNWSVWRAPTSWKQNSFYNFKIFIQSNLNNTKTLHQEYCGQIVKFSKGLKGQVLVATSWFFIDDKGCHEYILTNNYYCTHRHSNCFDVITFYYFQQCGIRFKVHSPYQNQIKFQRKELPSNVYCMSYDHTHQKGHSFIPMTIVLANFFFFLPQTKTFTYVYIRSIRI
jgi:hypothetical protein